jgi:hypothetical protein
MTLPNIFLEWSQMYGLIRNQDVCKNKFETLGIPEA